jgi:hypothetical protein
VFGAFARATVSTTEVEIPVVPGGDRPPVVLLHGNLHATCADWRIGASIDLAHDEADLGRVGGVLGVWRERFASEEAGTLPRGHFPPDELPEPTAAALVDFLA